MPDENRTRHLSTFAACSDCIYFSMMVGDVGAPGGATAGQCRRNPPVPDADTCWPSVSSKAWCGEFRSTSSQRPQPPSNPPAPPGNLP